MKVAIVHDYIKEYGGAERVLEAILEVFPNAVIYSLIYLPSFLGPHGNRFKKYKIKTSWFQYVPFKSKLVSPLRLIAPLLFKTFDFSKFDVIIVSQTGAYTPNLIKKEKAVQICYTHTPPRYLYGYATAREWKKNSLVRVFGEISNHILRMIDFKASQNVDYFIANSKNVASRIQKFYRRDAKVIYPPVEVPTTSNQQLAASKLKARSYYLAGGRIARPKHMDLIARTLANLKLPLKIFGRTFAGAKVDSIGEVSDEEKWELMRKAKGFIFASEDEDFGITPVEAQALGTPVIAYRSGGVLETVADGKTGLFFDELSTKSLADAIKKFNRMKFNAEEIKTHAQKFSKDRFKKEIKEFVEKHGQRNNQKRN